MSDDRSFRGSSPPYPYVPEFEWEPTQHKQNSGTHGTRHLLLSSLRRNKSGGTRSELTPDYLCHSRKKVNHCISHLPGQVLFKLMASQHDGVLDSQTGEYTYIEKLISHLDDTQSQEEGGSITFTQDTRLTALEQERDELAAERDGYRLAWEDVSRKIEEWTNAGISTRPLMPMVTAYKVFRELLSSPPKLQSIYLKMVSALKNTAVTDNDNRYKGQRWRRQIRSSDARIGGKGPRDPGDSEKGADGNVKDLEGDYNETTEVAGLLGRSFEGWQATST
ncbi:hypothetical protein C8R43DRAFT_966004 [Mycena crocata]|nr:hypothetical protein C8R43DRAFT_966004 [Mycena crocata]